jgi:hypothetical protein
MYIHTCGRFQVNDIPCGHAIACLKMLNQASRDHIPEFFSLEHYYYSYEKNVLPINVIALEAQATDNCLPPILKRGRGRPRTRRIRKGERQLRREWRERQGLLPDTEGRSANRCRLCGSVGHNSLTCVGPVQVPFVSHLASGKGFSWWVGLDVIKVGQFEYLSVLRGAKVGQVRNIPRNWVSLYNKI